ncbi:unnamed protein product [Acanthosepion pharaonis]|uniref:Uncharacterized protein n=1 Tax=Acanthosepion pharaonis TaxID=158019 RepID=A0A812APF2_ACAPH|nr:unnamed protein product [Sepia pharaonis]
MDLSFNCRLFAFILIALAIFAADDSKWNKRKLTTVSCGNNCSYIKAEGQSDILHYLFSGKPAMSILSIKTDTNGKLLINTKFSPPQIKVDPDKSFLYAFGIVFDKLIEYNDSKNTANIEKYDPAEWKNYSTAMEIVSNKQDSVVFFKSYSTDNVPRNITFSFWNFADNSRQDILPHLIVTSNSSLMNLVINNVKPSFSTSRFALAATYISHGNSRFSIKSEKSLDDEYSPGTFEVANWLAVSNNHNSFWQWKPVSYFGTPRSTMTSTYVKSYKLNTNFSRLPENPSLAYSFFTEMGDYNMSSNILSFGLTDDKFYDRNNYTAWSATFGYGIPPAETVSTLAIAIISVGLGIPALLFVGGGIYLCLKRRRNDYEPVFGTISS